MRFLCQMKPLPVISPVGAGETDGIRLLAKVARKVQCEYPLVHFHIVSGNRVTVSEDMDKGLIDFGLLFGEIDTSKYEYMRIPYKDSFGVLMRRDSPLDQKRNHYAGRPAGQTAYPVQTDDTRF